MINNIVIVLIILNTVCIGLLCFMVGRRIGAKEGIDYCFDRMCNKCKKEIFIECYKRWIKGVEDGNDD